MSSEFINLEVSLHLFHFGHTQSQVCSDNFANNIKGKRHRSKDFTKYLLKASHCFGCAWSQLCEQQTACVASPVPHCPPVGANSGHSLPHSAEVAAHVATHTVPCSAMLRLNLCQKPVEGREITRGDI